MTKQTYILVRKVVFAGSLRFLVYCFPFVWDTKCLAALRECTRKMLR